LDSFFIWERRVNNMNEIVVILVQYVLFHCFFKNSAINMIDDVKTSFRFYPKHYLLPPRWIRKLYGLKKKEIPKYLLYRLYVSLAFLLLIPINIFVLLISQINPFFSSIMILMPCVYIVLDSFIFIIVSRIFKKM